MRLAIIRRRYNPYGGAERFIERLTPLLFERGIETTLISEHWRSGAGSPTSVIQVSGRGFTRSRKFKSFANNVNAALVEQSKLNKFDLVQSHERIEGSNLYRAGDGVHAAWLNRLQRAYGPIRSWWHTRDPYHKAILEVERKMANDESLRYVVNSQMICNELQQYLSINPDRITLIPNGVNTTHFYPCTTEQRLCSRRALQDITGLQIDKHSKIIAFVGSGFKRKRVALLIDALAQLKNVYLIVCGKDKNFGQMKRLIAEKGLSTRVALTGPMDDVRQLLWASDIFSLPSLYDPSSNAVLEAMACGLPVVITEDVGMANEIEAGGAGLILRPGLNELSEILELALISEKVSSMSFQARKFACLYDEKIIAQAWLRLYKDLLFRKDVLSLYR